MVHGRGDLGASEVGDSGDVGACGVVEGHLGAVIADLGDDNPVAHSGRAGPNLGTHGDRPAQADTNPAGICPVRWISANTLIGSAPCWMAFFGVYVCPSTVDPCRTCWPLSLNQPVATTPHVRFSFSFEGKPRPTRRIWGG